MHVDIVAAQKLTLFGDLGHAGQDFNQERVGHTKLTQPHLAKWPPRLNYVITPHVLSTVVLASLACDFGYVGRR